MRWIDDDFWRPACGRGALAYAPGVKSVMLDIGRLGDGRGIFRTKVDLKATGRLAQAMSQLTRLVLRNYTTRTPVFTFGLEAMSGLKVLVVDCILDEHEVVSCFYHLWTYCATY